MTIAPANARSRRTRAALLAAAREILEQEGFAALTMGAVGERAGVTRRSVYLHFPSRTALVVALFDHNAEAEGLESSLARVWAAADAAATLEEWARHLVRYHPRLIALDRAIEHVRRVDPDAAALHRRIRAAQMAHCRRIARGIEDDLAPPWTPATAADALYALISSDVLEALLEERRWSRRRTADALGLLLTRTLLG